MKHSLPILSLVAAVAMTGLTGCSSFSSFSASQPEEASRSVPATSAQAGRQAKQGAEENRVQVRDEAGTVVVEKVEFKPGISSATVERLAREHGCVGSGGAGLMTEKGPVEVYRMQCENRKPFLARCELRQCRPMR